MIDVHRAKRAAQSEDAPSRRGVGAVVSGDSPADADAPVPWFALEPLPPLDEIRPEHIAYVHSVVARFGVTPTHWREDIAQEALLEAHRSRDSRLDVRALLFGIMRHTVFHWMARRCAEQAARAQLRAALRVTDRSAEDDYQEAERCSAVWAAIAGLPDIHREVFVRAEIEHTPMPQVARELRIPVNTGYTRLRLARACFLEALLRILARWRVKEWELL